jgi:hypothetical protein
MRESVSEILPSHFHYWGRGEIKGVKKDILTSKIFWTLFFIVSLNIFVYFPKLGI